MADYSGGVALSDFSFAGKMTLAMGWLLKSAVLFALFSALVIFKYALLFNGTPPVTIYTLMAIAVVVYSLAFLVFYIISEGIIQKMLVGMVISIIGAVVAAFFPPLGILLAVIGIISMIAKIISVIKMIPLLLLGVLLVALLFADVICVQYELLPVRNPLYANMRLSVLGFTIAFPKIMLGYLALSALVSLNLAFKYSLKNAMLRQVVIFMAIPIIALLIWLAKTALENAFYRPAEIQQGGFRKGKIWIKPYLRADGTPVTGYWRSLPTKL